MTPPAGSTCTAGGPGYALCPNGDVPKGGCFDNISHVVIGGTGQCPFPVFDADGVQSTQSDQDFRCINGSNNRPTVSTGVNQMDAAMRTACVPAASDGRVYNLHPHIASGGAYVSQRYTFTFPAFANLVGTANRQVVGAFYRIHETRTALTGFAGCAGDSCCTRDDSSAQIGCLTAANPCSIGVGSSNAANQEVPTVPAAGGPVAPRTVFATSVGGVENTQACTQKGAYPFSRALWLNTIAGFKFGGSVTGDELELARCFSGNDLLGVSIATLVASEGFTSIPVGCKSYDETRCGVAGPATNSCTNNPSGVANKLALGEPCTQAADCAGNVCTATKCSM